MLSSQELIEKLRTTPAKIEFTETMATIDAEYTFTPTEFTNGSQSNKANENNGSCKVFAFAKLHQLDEKETLHLFGQYYRQDVLENPTAEDHQNIRQFMVSGWGGITFDCFPLMNK